MTKTYRIWYWVLTVLSFLLCAAPPVGYTITALFGEGLVIQKFALSATVVMVIIMTIISKLSDVALRSRLWILLIGLYFCLDNILTPLIIIAVCQVLDELIVCPIRELLSTKLTISKTLDKRLGTT